MSRTSAAIAFGGALLLACASTPGPEETAHAYARALSEGRLDDAYALVAPSQKAAGLSEEAFDARYGDPSARAARAQSVSSAASDLRAQSASLTLVRGEDGWRVVEPMGDGGAQKALQAFISFAEAGDFVGAYGLLASELRARYTPQLLERDFAAEPLAKERLERAKLAAAKEPTLKGEQALFPIGDGKAVRLRVEDGAYRVVALE